MGAGEEVDGEGDIAIGVEMPAGAVQVMRVCVGERDAFPAEAGGLPAEGGRIDSEDVMEAGEDKNTACRGGEDLGNGAEGEMDAAVGGKRVDHVCVAAGEGKKVVGM